METPPDEQDPDWPKYPETILSFGVGGQLRIDLREAPSEAEREALVRLGLGQPFAVMTAFDPKGKNLSPAENDRLAKTLNSRLAGMGREFLHVDACSPDGSHCECSVAVTMPQNEALSLAAEFGQMAIFWFDGTHFWILGALLPTDPIVLPRSS